MRAPSKVELRRIAVASFVIAGVVIAGCVKNTSPAADGASCQASQDCASKQCAYGACAGRTCDKEDAGECDPGWVCAGGDQSDLARAFGDDDGPSCAPTCGVCPATGHCPAFGGAAASANGADAGVFCTSGPARTATITGPDTVKAGEVATYTVTFAPDQKFEVYDWYYGLVGETPDLILGSPGTKDNTFMYAVRGSPLGESDAIIGVEASDVNISYDDHLQTAEGVRTIHVTCSAKGEDCTNYGSCCAPGSSCQFDGGVATCQ